MGQITSCYTGKIQGSFSRYWSGQMKFWYKYIRDKTIFSDFYSLDFAYSCH